MPDEAWLKILGQRGLFTIQQYMDARIEQARCKISFEEALVRLGVYRADILAAKKVLNLPLEDPPVLLIDSEETSNLFNELTEEIWISIGKNTDVIKTAPQWVLDILNIPFSKIMKLPTFNDVAWLDINDDKKFVRRPEARTRKVDQSYIGIFQGKMKYDNLSDDFIRICERTIRSLEKHYNQNLITIQIYGNCTFLLDIVADDLQYVHSEEITLEMIQKAIDENRKYFC